jgi:hypothetical protein
MPYSSAGSYQTKEPAAFKFRAEKLRVVKKTVHNTQKGGLILELRVNQSCFSMEKRRREKEVFFFFNESRRNKTEGREMRKNKRGEKGSQVKH